MNRQPVDSIFINHDFRIIAESDDWVVADKPAHLLIHPTRPDGPFTLWNGLRYLYAYELACGGQISIINRLDRETSGLVLAAKHTAAARRLVRLMERHQIHKEYLAIVSGWPVADTFTVDAPLLRQGEVLPSRIWVRQTVHPEGAEAFTRFVVEQRFGSAALGCFSLIRAFPLTGRTHQIRVHLAHAGHPVVGDKIYGPDEELYLRFIETGWSEDLAGALLLPRHALHSAGMSIASEGWAWKAELPADMAGFIRDRFGYSQT